MSGGAAVALASASRWRPATVLTALRPSATCAARRLLALPLYAVVPPIGFFNIARLDASADVVGGLLLRSAR